MTSEGPAPAERPLANDEEELAAKEVTEEVWAFYRDKRAFRARFTHRFWWSDHKPAHGVVTFRRPARFSFRYEPGQSFVVSEADRVRVYSQDCRCSYETPIAESQYSAVLAFLTGNIEDSFRVRRLDSTKTKYFEGPVIQAVAKETGTGFAKMVLEVDHRSHEIRRVFLLDGQGNRHCFEFEEPEYDIDVPDDEFRVELPPGTTIVTPPREPRAALVPVP